MGINQHILSYYTFKNKATSKIGRVMTPYDLHRYKMKMRIVARGIKQTITTNAISKGIKIPTAFSKWHVTSTQPSHIQAYISKRHKRDNWVVTLNTTLELGYTTTKD